MRPIATAPKTTTTSGPGTLGISARSTRMITSDDDAKGRSDRVDGADASPDLDDLEEDSLGRCLEAEQLGKLAHDDHDRDAVHVAEAHGL